MTTPKTKTKTNQNEKTPGAAPQKTEQRSGRKMSPPVEHAREMLSGLRHDGRPSTSTAPLSSAPPSATTARSGASRTRSERNAAAKREK